MARQGIDNASSTNTLLQSLLKRPDVRSALILSRKDGSIIKAAGLIAESANEISRDKSRFTTSTAEDCAEGIEGGDEAQAGAEPQAEVSRAQALARSIFHFVASATALGTALSGINTVSGPMLLDDDQSRKEEGADERPSAGEDIQLLRLRLSKQEVIIFPDPSYLCCVVQDLDKGSR